MQVQVNFIYVNSNLLNFQQPESCLNSCLSQFFKYVLMLRVYLVVLWPFKYYFWFIKLLASKNLHWIFFKLSASFQSLHKPYIFERNKWKTLKCHMTVIHCCQCQNNKTFLLSYREHCKCFCFTHSRLKRIKPILPLSH